MDTLDAVKTRKSVRAYDPKPVPAELLRQVLEAGRIAPSAMNYQPWHFVVVTDPERRTALSGGRWAKFLKATPVVIVGLGDHKASPKWHVVDVTIALENMVLAATSLGLGTCWIGSFHEDEVKAALNISNDWTVVAMLALGYEKRRPDAVERVGGEGRKRRALEEIVSYESLGRSEPA